MRLKTFTASTMAEAMDMVRQSLGDDAVIVSTQRASGGGGVRITAALEETGDLDNRVAQEFEPEEFSGPLLAIRNTLTYHRAPRRVADRLIQAARDSELPEPKDAMAAACERVFDFAPLPERISPRPFMLVGPPGTGKTMTVAKLAARARLSHRRVSAISIDTIRAGALEQLAAFTRILQIDLVKARDPRALRAALDDMTGYADLVFIDSPGLNPFNPQDMDYLQAMIEAADAEPILTLSAGGDAEEAEEIAEAFAAVGATRLLATRLDMTRRLGGVLGAADAGQLMLCDVSVEPNVATGLHTLIPASLAGLLLADEASAAPVPQNDDTMTLSDDDEPRPVFTMMEEDDTPS